VRMAAATTGATPRNRFVIPMAGKGSENP
jgi:hypothetical protein